MLVSEKITLRVASEKIPLCARDVILCFYLDFVICFVIMFCFLIRFPARKCSIALLQKLRNIHMEQL